MPKITTSVTTRSMVGRTEVGTHLERVARHDTVVELRSSRTRVIVTMQPDGSARVETFRLAPGARPDDADRIVWNDDASVIVPAEREKPTAIEATPHTTITATEPLPF